jgi:uncharacterized protein YbbK (DUF523 family)
MLNNRITIGVSSCLLGHKIRYDGNDKLNRIVESDLCKQFTCVPLCPEYAIGLGVPRNPVQLVQNGESLLVLGVGERSLDIAPSLRQYADFVCDLLPHISGYVFKSRSPSCGFQDTPIYDIHGCEIDAGRGAYAEQILHNYHALPVVDEVELSDPEKRCEFILEVKNYSLHRKR